MRKIKKVHADLSADSLEAPQEAEIVIIQDITLAAALCCVGQNPWICDAGGSMEGYVFLNSSAFNKAIKKVNSDSWWPNPKVYEEKIKYLRSFVEESIQINAAEDSERLGQK